MQISLSPFLNNPVANSTLGAIIKHILRMLTEVVTVIILAQFLQTLLVRYP